MSTDLVDPLASVRSYLDAEKSSNTREAYASDFRDFSEWCGRVDETPLPASPLVVARYLAQLADAGRKVSTIERRVAAIRYLHKAAGHEPPTNTEGVKAVLRGIRRRIGTRPVRKAPATAEILLELLAKCGDGLAQKRDRALLLVGFAAALRRSELVALQVSDVSVRPRGIILHIRSSKTDQESAGQDLPIPRGGRLRPVQALEAWLEASGISEGPIFREVDRHGNVGAAALSDRSVARIIKRVVREAGIDERVFSGHSLRAGFATSALDAGVDPLMLMKTTRHASVKTLAIYDRRESDFDTGAGSKVL